MKKLLLILLAVCIILPASGFAQMSFGFLAGINLANFGGDDKDFGIGIDPKMKLGLAGGALVQVPLSDNMAFRVEALYSQKGAKYEAGGNTAKVNMDYIEVPLLVMFQIPTTGSVLPFLLGGGYLGYLMSAKITNGGPDVNVKDDCNSLDYGIMVGAGALINNMIEICARYSMGLGTVVKNPDNIDVKNSVIQILAGFHL